MVQSQEPASLTIGKLAAAGNVGVETIRFYQRKGLLDTPTRQSGVRHYSPGDVRRLRFIRQAQAAGFTLEEIRELLQLDASEDRSRARALATVRVEALDARMAELKAARDACRGCRHSARKAAEAPAPSWRPSIPEREEVERVKGIEPSS